jgi:hypothetical protein
MMHTYPSTPTAVPNEQQVVNSYLLTQSFNVRFVMRQNRVSDVVTKVRVERNFVRHVLTRDTIVVVHHNLMDLVNSISKPTVTHNGMVTIARNFPRRDERNKFI